MRWMSRSSGPSNVVELHRVCVRRGLELEQRARHRLAVDGHVLLVEMPAARAHEQHRGAFVELVGLVRRRIDEADAAADRVLQVLLAFDDVGPGRRRRVLAIGHEHVGARVEGVDDHLAIDRAGDLDAAVEDLLGQGMHLPVAGAHLRGLGEEVGRPAAIELGLDLTPAARSSSRRLSKRRWSWTRKSRAPPPSTSWSEGVGGAFHAQARRQLRDLGLGRLRRRLAAGWRRVAGRAVRGMARFLALATGLRDLVPGLALRATGFLRWAIAALPLADRLPAHRRPRAS